MDSEIYVHVRMPSYMEIKSAVGGRGGKAGGAQPCINRGRMSDVRCG